MRIKKAACPLPLLAAAARAACLLSAVCWAWLDPGPCDRPPCVIHHPAVCARPASPVFGFSSVYELALPRPRLKNALQRCGGVAGSTAGFYCGCEG
jgi:hypothetical protein